MDIRIQQISSNLKIIQNCPSAIEEEKKYLVRDGTCEDCKEPKYKVASEMDRRFITCLNPACLQYAEIFESSH